MTAAIDNLKHQPVPLPVIVKFSHLTKFKRGFCHQLFINPALKGLSQQLIL
jgi:hypothetical protein